MTEPFYIFPAPAKLNLFLHIVGRRDDGYHELETLFQFLDYNDQIEIAINQSGEINLLTPIAGVEAKDNLIVKAALLLKKHTNCSQGANIKIDKILPMGGGLGGGSSNAATVLLALNLLWQLNLPLSTLAQLGLSLGADVPIFIHGYAAIARGVGEKLSAINPKEYWYLITKPNVHISTAAIFNDPQLPRDTVKLSSNDIEVESCRNDCQTLVINRYPEVAKLLTWLVEYAPSRMTGTGACIFSRFTTQKEAVLVQSKLPQGIESFVAQGVNQSTLHAQLAKVALNFAPK
ncbi:4-(cytidine 5'-diphospho)-2-C-methyl-D-erythritol kinase [Thalassotalea profundi]|uniref:4-diphosphocytidyl-2-C-methyl-D-erythritol kinase n=1 Tax=Thalassotalea profundi TaxID=2036687 RepID=A0ABQ3IK46_9GAMM|nr:4-(cytidine 5'-diphospho)-2-C-methyl-D-erythritol kinase [Thalassotalea profundi]GHE85128.1 4-diphosphocytidyl-2-C-methyl-D-erythritol kinase [Thalassotalea profundi]